MRFAVIADTHIGRSIPLAIAEHRRKAFNLAFTKTIDKCIEKGVDYVFIAGDLFERRTLRPYLVQFVHKELYRLAVETKKKHGYKISILVVRGNHDGRPQSDTLDYIRHPLAEYLFVFGDSPEDAVYSDEQLHVVGINYYDQIEKAFDYFTESFEEAQGIRILMLHHFISGYNEVPPYSECLSLDKLAEKNPDFVFTGHYHRKCEPKQLPNGGWILTPGSLEMYDFAEIPDKGFYFVEVNDKTPRFEWESLEPLHVMKQVNLIADRRRPPKWYINKIKDIVNEFVDELKKVKKEGYIRIVVKGQLSQGFPGDVSTKGIEEIVENEPLLLWVDIETMRLDLPTMIARFEKNSNDISEFFKDFGDFHTDIREMHIKVRETLENEGSERTGLLTPTNRSRFIKEWVERFESKTFKEIDE